LEREGADKSKKASEGKKGGCQQGKKEQKRSEKIQPKGGLRPRRKKRLGPIALKGTADPKGHIFPGNERKDVFWGDWKVEGEGKKKKKRRSSAVPLERKK